MPSLTNAVRLPNGARLPNWACRRDSAVLPFRFFFFFVLLLLGSPALLAHPGQSTRGGGALLAQTAPTHAVPDLRSVVHQDLIRVAAPGAVLAWIDRDGVRWLDAFGSQDLEGSLPMHLRHRMHLGTFGDLLLAALALEMDALGVVSMDAPVRTLVGGLAPGVGSRPLTSLLLHTGGFDAAPLAARPRGTEAGRTRVEEAIRLLDDRVIMLPVGTIRSPSPHHTLLATHVLTARGGGSLEGAFRTYLFRPAGVMEVAFAPPGGAPAGVHPGFQVRLAPGAPHVEAPFPEPAVLQPQERLWMHAVDLGRLLHHWIFLHPNGTRLLTPRVRDPEAPSAQSERAFSLGFHWDGAGRAVWQGEGPGHTTEVRILPEYGALLMAMANGGASPLPRGLDALEAWVRGEASGPSHPQPTPPKPTPPSNPWGMLAGDGDLPHPAPVTPDASVAGRYRNGSEVFHLRWREGALEADLGIGVWLPIREAEDHALEVYLEDGRSAFRFRLLRVDSAGLMAAYTRGMVFIRDVR